MSNIIQTLVSAYKSGGDPYVLIQQMAAQNPQLAPALQMMQGKNASQLQTIAENMAREKHIDLNSFMHQIGIM